MPLDDRKLDLENPAIVALDGEEIHGGTVNRTWGALVHSTVASGNPGGVFAAEIPLK